MNKILSNLILGSCVSTSLMPEKLLMEHTMLLAILSSHIGSEVGKYTCSVLINKGSRCTIHIVFNQFRWHKLSSFALQM